jgi:hypothetical protein
MMKTLALTVIALALTTALPAFAEPQNWLTRCNRALNNGNNDPETGSYTFATRGQIAPDATSRANFDYTATGSPTAAVYPTAAKDLMNPYSGGSVSLGYFVPNDGKAKPTVGQVSMSAIARNFKPIPGAPVKMKLVIDGVAFGPYEPRASANTDGMYSVWLDTADMDGDSKPPLLEPADFAKLANAVDTMTAAEIILVQDGTSIVQLPVPSKQRLAWRDGLAPWAAETARQVAFNMCSGSDRVVN